MIRPPPSSTLFPYTALFRSLAVTDPAQMPVREARPREPKTATVERREASVPRHGKCSLHSTLYDSTAVWIIPRNIVLLQHSAVLRSMVLHSYIPDTDRTLEAPDPCPNHAMPSSK